MDGWMDGRMDGKTDAYIAPFYKQVRQNIMEQNDPSILYIHKDPFHMLSSAIKFKWQEFNL